MIQPSAGPDGPGAAAKISVVVSTYKRAETLRETCARLAAQDLPSDAFEVIVVDDGSPDHTQDVVRELLRSLPVRLRYLRHDNAGPGYTQNRGIEAASAPLVLLIADDIWLKPQALRAHLEAHERHPEPEVAVLGRVVQSPRLTETLLLRTHDPFRFGQLDGLEWLPYYFFWGCNISFKRSFMTAHGMFREDHGPGGVASHEDTEVGYRLAQHGLRIRYEQAAVGEHYHHETLEHFIGRAYMRGLNYWWFRDLAPAPELSVRYRTITDWRCVGDHVRAWWGPRRALLIGGDRRPLQLLATYVARTLVFNGWAVDRIWLPLVRTAERNQRLANWVRPMMYRGIVNRSFYRGCRDGKLSRPRSQPERPATGPRLTGL